MQINLKEKMSSYNLPDKIAVAVSGGADSLALTLMLNEVFSGKLIALTVNHNLRQESSKEAKQVGEWLGSYGIEHHILDWEGKKPTGNIEAVARKKRYQLLTEFCVDNDISCLFVAHNQSDQAETFLLRLQRSSGLLGLAGMEEESFYNNVKIIRPLLDVKRQELETYLTSLDQVWVHDSFNDDERYERVKMRKFLPELEKHGLSVDAITKAMKNLQADKKIIKNIVSEVFETRIVVNPIGYIEMDISVYDEPYSIFLYIISELYSRLGLEIPWGEKIAKLYEGKGNKTITLGGLLFCKKNSKMLIGFEYDKVKDITKNVKAGETIHFLGFTIKSKFDTIISTLGDFTNKDIKKTGIPALIRKSMPVLNYNGIEKISFLEKNNSSIDFSVVYTPYININEI